LNENKNKHKTRSVWERKWIQRRKTLGACAGLERELRLEDPSQFRNFIRMSAEDFVEELCSLNADFVNHVIFAEFRFTFVK